MEINRLAVFCGSSLGNDAVYRQAAEQLGGELARRSIELVYGGARVGLMGTLADAVLAGGGAVTGVMPRFLREKEIDHRGLTYLELVESMHERKTRMAALADAFVALPGGFGTFEEFFEAVTWTQLGLHDKPCLLLNVAGFYDPIGALLENAVQAGLLNPQNRSIVGVCESVEEVFEKLAQWEPGKVQAKWITREET